MGTEELRQRLAAHGLDTHGRRALLIDRLEDALLDEADRVSAQRQRGNSSLAAVPPEWDQHQPHVAMPVDHMLLPPPPYSAADHFELAAAMGCAEDALRDDAALQEDLEAHQRHLHELQQAVDAEEAALAHSRGAAQAHSRPPQRVSTTDGIPCKSDNCSEHAQQDYFDLPAAPVEEPGQRQTERVEAERDELPLSPVPAPGPPPAPAFPAQEAEVPDGLVCPITDELMLDPVLCADGHSYERANIQAWLENHDTSPLTGVALEHKLLVPNHALRKVAEEWQNANLPRGALQ